MRRNFCQPEMRSQSSRNASIRPKAAIPASAIQGFAGGWSMKAKVATPARASEDQRTSSERVRVPTTKVAAAASAQMSQTRCGSTSHASPAPTKPTAAKSNTSKTS